jgi:hypothetical protein
MAQNTAPSQSCVKAARDSNIGREMPSNVRKALLQANIGKKQSEAHIAPRIRLGETNKAAKLTTESVKKIRARSNERKQALADEFGVSFQTSIESLITSTGNT